MKIYVSAEFETEDFADIASLRLKRFCRVFSTHVTGRRKKGSNYTAGDGFELYSPYLNSVLNSLYPWPAFLEPRFLTDSRRRDFSGADFKNEALERLDFVLEVSAENASAARCVSEILVNAGGRNLRTVKK